MITLRGYQDRGVGEVRQGFRDGHRAVLYQLPTGGGKTLTAGYILKSAAERGNPGMFICNRVELVEQTAAAFDRLGLPYGLIAAGYTPNYRQKVQIASIDTLKRRLDQLLWWPKLAVWDECRSLAAAGWSAVYKRLLQQGTAHLGLDATPQRLDGKGLDAFFSLLVQGPSMKELQAHDPPALVPFEAYTPSKPVLTGVRTRMGDYASDELEEAMDKPSITGNIVETYVKMVRGKQGLTFAVSRKHSEHLAAEYRAAGIRAEHLDGDTDKGRRSQIVRAYRNREIDVLCNVDLFTAGFDVPGVEVITMARPTQSLTIYLQQAGRGSRPEPEIGKTHCVLLDHAGNILRHGLPDEDREWSLEGRKKRAGKKADDGPAVQIRQCEVCFYVHSPAPCCPKCGFVYPVQHREVEEREGELKKVTAEQLAAMRRANKREVGMAKSLADLQAIEKQRGYKPGWAQHVWESKSRSSNARAEAQAAAYRDGRW